MLLGDGVDMDITAVLSIVDTAVKIGLGAVITGLITYHVAKLNHERDLKKLLALRRLEALEKISEQAEQFFSHWRKLASRLGGVLKGNNPPATAFSEDQWKSIKARDKSLLEARDTMYQVLARLHLLKANAAADYIAEISKLVGDFREPLILQKEIPSRESLKETRQSINALITKFHDELSTLYAEIQ